MYILPKFLLLQQNTEYCRISCLGISIRKIAHTSIKWGARSEWRGKWSSWAGSWRAMTAQHLFPTPPPCWALLPQDFDSGGLEGGLEIFATPKVFWHEAKVGEHCCKLGTGKRSSHRGTKMTRIWCYPTGVLVWAQWSYKHIFQCNLINALSTLPWECRERAVSESEWYLFWKDKGILRTRMEQGLSKCYLQFSLFPNNFQ